MEAFEGAVLYNYEFFLSFCIIILLLQIIQFFDGQNASTFY